MNRIVKYRILLSFDGTGQGSTETNFFDFRTVKGFGFTHRWQIVATHSLILPQTIKQLRKGNGSLDSGVADGL